MFALKIFFVVDNIEMLMLQFTQQIIKLKNISNCTFCKHKVFPEK